VERFLQHYKNFDNTNWTGVGKGTTTDGKEHKPKILSSCSVGVIWCLGCECF